MPLHLRFKKRTPTFPVLHALVVSLVPACSVPFETSGALMDARREEDPSQDVSCGGTGRWVSGYYVGYLRSLYPPSAISWAGLTHLMIARVVPNADGSLDTTFDIDPVNGPALARQLVFLAHQNGKKAIVMLGGAGTHDAFASAASSAHRATLVRNLVAVAADYGFDGFDFDWEPLQQADQPSFQALVQSMRAALPRAIFTMPVGWMNDNFSTVDAYFSRIAPLFQQINIMSYGMADAWPGWQSWHSGALRGETPTTPSSVDSSVNAYLAAGVPPEKLGIGIGFFGSCWSRPVNAPRQDLSSSSVVAGDNVMTFDHIMNAYYTSVAYRWDAAAQMPYLGFPTARGPEGCTFVSYEDERSILEKGAYVKQRGLGGTIVWNINEGYRPSLPTAQRDPLMSALRQGFLD